MKSSFQNSSNPLKALILAGGRGKRLDHLTDEENKCMIEFEGIHLIEHSLENALTIGVDEIIIVVGHLAERIINTYGNSYKDIRIKYCIQREQLGLVHAIESAKGAMDGSDFILLLGDEFFRNGNHKTLLKAFAKNDVFAVCGVLEVKNRKHISKTYSILFDKESRIIFRLIEKPQNPINNMMGTGNIIFRNQIFDYVKETPINQKRGEKELPDLVQCAIDDGKKVVYDVLASEYVNVNTPEDIRILNRKSQAWKEKE